MKKQQNHTTREEVLAAIEQYRPWGSGVGPDDLIIVTAQAYSIPGMPRVAVFRRDTYEVLYNGGLKDTNTHFVEWCRRKATGREPMGFGIREEGSRTLYEKMVACQTVMLQEWAERLNWLNVPLKAKSLTQSFRVVFEKAMGE